MKVDYKAEIEKLEKEIVERNNKRNQLEGLLTAKRSELAKLEEEIMEKFGCSPDELVPKAEGMKVDLEKKISSMKASLGLSYAVGCF